MQWSERAAAQFVVFEMKWIETDSCLQSESDSDYQLRDILSLEKMEIYVHSKFVSLKSQQISSSKAPTEKL